MWAMGDIITPERARELLAISRDDVWTLRLRSAVSDGDAALLASARRLCETVVAQSEQIAAQAEEIERLRALSVDSPPSNWQCPACGTLHIEAPAPFKCSCGTHRG